jgi:hypothetical protein
MKDIKNFLEEKKSELPSIEDFTWNTEYDLPDNTAVMMEWIDVYMPEEVILIEESLDGTYSEIINEEGHKFACHASGNGDFFNHKINFELLERNYKNNLIYKDILDNDDLQALDMLINENPLNNAEKKHYLTGVDWDDKIARLKKEELFTNQELKAIKKLVSEDKLTTAEKRYYILGTEIKDKIEDLKQASQKKFKINNIKKLKSNDVTNINELKEGDQLLMNFEEKGVRDHLWCTVNKIEDESIKSGKRILTISVNDEVRNLNVEKMIEYGLLKENKSLLFDYCKGRYRNLEIGENSYNKRVIKVDQKEEQKIKSKKSFKL